MKFWKHNHKAVEWEPAPLDQPMTSEQIAETCEVTAEILEGQWGIGHWWDPAFQTMCLEGALVAAFGINLDEFDVDREPARQRLAHCPVYTAIQETIRLREPDFDPLDHGPDWLPAWNDQDDRTEQEVLDILHATAKRVLGVQA